MPPLTEDGNWDLVGNNLGVFFIRDAIKFPDFIHSQKPDPVSFERQVPNRVFDFISQSPESMHMVTLVFGPRGVPASYRTMQLNYEPSITGGLSEGPKPAHAEQGPEVNARLTRARIPRTDDYRQAGERYQLSDQWEKDDLVGNLSTLLGACDRPIQERMVWHLLLCDDELGQRVGEGLGITAGDVRSLEPVPTQGWGEAEQQRLDNLGSNGPRDVEGLVMTHCVPNEHVAIADEAVAAS